MVDTNEEFNQMISEIEKKFDAYIMLEYSEICDGIIYEKERIYAIMIHFLERNKIDKAEFLVDILQRYYFGYIQNRVEKLIAEEKFEELILLEPFLNSEKMQDSTQQKQQ